MSRDQEQTRANDLHSALQSLRGEALGSVAFVEDYWQLDFSGFLFTVMSKIAVTDEHGITSPGDAGFRDRLCEQIGHRVDSIAFQAGEGISMTFSGGSVVQLSAKPPDYHGPEAIIIARPNPGQPIFVV